MVALPTNITCISVDLMEHIQIEQSNLIELNLIKLWNLKSIESKMQRSHGNFGFRMNAVLELISVLVHCHQVDLKILLSFQLDIQKLFTLNWIFKQSVATFCTLVIDSPRSISMELNIWNNFENIPFTICSLNIYIPSVCQNESNMQYTLWIYVRPFKVWLLCEWQKKRTECLPFLNWKQIILNGKSSVAIQVYNGWIVFFMRITFLKKCIHSIWVYLIWKRARLNNKHKKLTQSRYVDSLNCEFSSQFAICETICVARNGPRKRITEMKWRRNEGNRRIRRCVKAKDVRRTERRALIWCHWFNYVVLKIFAIVLFIKKNV